MSNRNRVDVATVWKWDLPRGTMRAVPMTSSFWNALVDLGVTPREQPPRRPNPFKPANVLPNLKDWYFDILEEKHLNALEQSQK